MKQSIETLLHIPCKQSDYNRTDALPLFLRGAYQYIVLQIAGIDFLVAKPVEKASLATMRKHWKKLMEVSGMECTFCLEAISAYTKQKMLEEGIPFILGSKELYLPFLGTVLVESKQEKRISRYISYLTQKMLLTMIYRGVKVVTATEMARILGVSKMSVTRSFNELEACGLGLIENKGTAGRYFHWEKSLKELWETIAPILRRPVEKELLLDCEPPYPLPMGGLTAISYFTSLADNRYRTYAISKKQLKDLQIEKLPQVPQGEVPVTIVQVMGYSYLYEKSDKQIIDPLSAILCLSEDEKKDPRVEHAMEEILKEYVYDRT